MHVLFQCSTFHCWLWKIIIFNLWDAQRVRYFTRDIVSKVHSSLICSKANKHSFSIQRCPVKDKSSFWRRRWFLWIWVKSTMSIRNALCPYVKLWRIIHQNTLNIDHLSLFLLRSFSYRIHIYKAHNVKSKSCKTHLSFYIVL